MTVCILCGADTLDRVGAVRHEPCCPHFMRGPDPGGDPHEWVSLLDLIEEEKPTVGVEERYHVPRSQVWGGSRGRQRGGLHLHVLADVKLGRIMRQRGGSLCGRRGWYERPPEHAGDRTPCERCSEIAERHGIEWPSPLDLPTPTEEK